jgi:hypothetical protein
MALKMVVSKACNLVAIEIYSEWISVAFDTGVWPKQAKAVAKQLEKVCMELKISPPQNNERFQKPSRESRKF